MMNTVPTLKRVTAFEPGIYLNYAGSRGTRFAVPLKTSGQYTDRAIVFGADDNFEETAISIENSFLIVGASIILPSVTEMIVGVGALKAGYVSPFEGRVALSYRVPFDELEWLEIDTGNSLEAKVNRHFFGSWSLVVASAGSATTTLFQRSTS